VQVHTAEPGVGQVGGLNAHVWTCEPLTTEQAGRGQ
jgi:hypothetical protein